MEEEKVEKEELEAAIEGLKKLKEIPIFKWEKDCWSCHKSTPVVSYNFFAAYDLKIGDVPKLDEELIKKYAFVKRVFSKTMKEEVIANTCIHCGALQGNWYIMEDIVEMEAGEIDFSKMIDTKIKNNLSIRDLGYSNNPS
jgi:hypothetical protein